MKRSIFLTVAVLVVLLSSCARDSGSDDEFHVTSEVVSHEASKDVLVFAPDAEGPWPVVVAFHGIGGTGQDMAEIATRLAREGSVVFVPTTRPTSPPKKVSTGRRSMPNVATASLAASRPSTAVTSISQ